ncbi:hypothetical protein BC830DRAFT_1112881 [Chytriomyces sp. MP71]|nr:hypothetical protein BC830DRAFT_1112881 [Chytriomyces sp. MP71]
MLFNILTLAIVAATQVSALASVGDNFVGGYVLFGDPTKLKLLAQSAATLPVNRIWLSFARPDMYYEPNSKTLQGVGLNYNNTQSDYGFAEIQGYVKQLQAGGVEVFLSMGGWDYNCWPWAYMQKSIYDYGTTTATFQSTIGTYGGGDPSKCNESNQFCYACEPPSNGNTPDSYAIFPEPGNSPTWKQAQAYVANNNKMDSTPVWHPEIIGGAQYKDARTGRTVSVVGSTVWNQKGRDPYQDLVYVAKDLGLDGVDIDYEEFWHADLFKVDGSASNNCGNGCTLFQTIFKYSAILQDVRINIQNIYPSLKLSTAASAAGAWAGTWWGGNLKGLTLNMVPSYPDLVQFIGTGANAGGWNVMSYDLSNSQVNCPPAPATCNLDGQVNFYMAQYAAAGVSANVGYEIGSPAYPPPADATHQMPLSNSLASAIISNTQPYYKGGFFWELFKPQGTKADVPVSALAQALCKQVLGANTPRCSGSLPVLNDEPLPGSSLEVPISKPSGPAPSGPVPCAAPYDKNTQYTAGMQFSYNGYNYQCTYWVPAGTAPGQPGLPQQGICVSAPSTPTSSSAVPVPTTSAVPVTSAKPSSTSVIAPSSTAAPASSSVMPPPKSSTTAVVPPTSAPAPSPTTSAGSTNPACYPAFVQGNSYNGGATASDKGSNYHAKWWSNTAPSVNDGSWALEGLCGSGNSTSPIPVVSSSSVAVPPSPPAPTTSTAPKTTSSVVAPPSGAISNGATCLNFGAWACNYACLCNNVIASTGAYATQWQCTPATASC